MIIYVFGARDIYIFNENVFEPSEYIMVFNGSAEG